MPNFAKLLRSKIEARDPAFLKYETGNLLIELFFLFVGVCMRSKQKFSPDSLNFAPFVLVPSTFPRLEFNNAINLQPLINELFHKIANNFEFLKNALSV